MSNVFATLSRRNKFLGVLVGNSLRDRLIRAGLGSAGIQAASRIVALAIGILLARTLGPDGYGVYAYAFAIMSLLMVASEAGVPTLLMREVAASEGREEWALLKGALRRGLQFVGSAACSVSLLGLLALWGFADSLQQEVLHTMALMLLVLPIAAMSKTVAHALRGLHRVVVGQAVDMLLQPLLVLAMVGSMFLLSPDWQRPQVAMAAQLLAALVVLTLGWVVLRRSIPTPVLAAQPAYRSRQWLRSALPFTLVGGAGIINSQADIIMLGWFTGPDQVGIYRVAVQGAGLVVFGLQVVNAVVAPQFSRLYAQGDMARLQHLVTQSARVVLLVAMPTALVFLLAGEEVVSWVFGHEFTAASAPLAILTLGQLINAGFGSVGFLLNMTGHESLVARILWQTAALNVLLNAALIPLYGGHGAALATALSLAVWNVLLYRQARLRLGIVSTAIRIRTR